MAEGEQLLRQWKLVRILAARRHGVELRDLAREADVSSRTITRDLNTLRDVGFPIIYEKRPHGLRCWKLTSQDGIPALNFNWDELAALYLGRRLLEPLAGTVFDDAARSALEKIRSNLPEAAVDYLERLATSVYQTPFGRGDYHGKDDIIDSLRTAIEDGCICVMSYQPLRATEAVTYEVYPLGLALHRGALYLVAFDADKRATRHYKVIRIDSAEVQALKFELPPEIAGFSLDQHFTHSFGIFQKPGPPTAVRLRFTRDVARIVQETHLHASQQITPQPDGHLLVELTLTALEEVKTWVLTFGSKAEVLEPASLRIEMQQELRLALAAYETKRPARKRGVK